MWSRFKVCLAFVVALLLDSGFSTSLAGVTLTNVTKVNIFNHCPGLVVCLSVHSTDGCVCQLPFHDCCCKCSNCACKVPTNIERIKNINYALFEYQAFVHVVLSLVDIESGKVHSNNVLVYDKSSTHKKIITIDPHDDGYEVEISDEPQ